MSFLSLLRCVVVDIVFGSGSLADLNRPLYGGRAVGINDPGWPILEVAPRPSRIA